MYLLGGCLGPLVTGMLSDHFATKAMVAADASVMTEQFKAIGLHSAMYAIPIICALLACVLLAASRTVSADVEKLRKWLREQETLG